MNPAGNLSTNERASMQAAEDARQKEWTKPSFLRDLFLGRFHFDRVYPFPGLDREDRAAYREFTQRLKAYLLEEIDPLEIDATGEFPKDIVSRLAELGALGMNIPSEYEGQGFTKTEYCRILALSGSYEGSMMGFLSPHQSVGVPECLKLFGTEEQKREYLPRCAKGEISAFALTENEVGSDPARLTTSLENTPDGEAYLLNGTKLWCTNGTVAKLLVVMARHKETGKISAVLVETHWPGVSVEHRCRFMGLSALQNGVIRFENVRVPKSNLIGKEGMGLRIALTALKTGRLSIPYGVVGGAKKGLEVARVWAAARHQWGRRIGEHEAIALKVADIATKTFAMESVVRLACEMTDAGRFDTRLESAAAKEYNTSRVWEIVDDVMQIRGGRGYEKETSLRARGERPMPVERMMRDLRVSRIFEGASEIMHLLIAREAVDKHLQVAGPLLASEGPLTEKIKAIPRIAAFYLAWYPSTWFTLRGWVGYGEYAPFSDTLRFIHRRAMRLARQVFHGMLRYGPGLQRRQGFLFRWVDIALDLFAMTAVISRALTAKAQKHPDAEKMLRVAQAFCDTARLRVDRLFRELWHNTDSERYQLAQEILEGRHTWLEEGIITLEEQEAAEVRRTVQRSRISAEQENSYSVSPLEDHPSTFERVPSEMLSGR